ncbi:ImmA/IrrE family metallo-endopeptidase [Luteolibacter sp. SL250]|uniref:ImmA/IrrE family metallo-endopeptidase n=1 Tax=Luteolibacter sp. SL250 TaxID=2995170 RepID=UPI00226D6BE3|nr:ImmA/IrrE family metallo-endopeptidase [Luteolibacter sp. SL250]WAC19011.1 ImmA/IrrE family metallo-endopeptidase [Luteolibacter sp. SL250]
MLAEAVSPDRLDRNQIQKRIEVMWNHLFPRREIPLLEYPVEEIATELQRRRLVEFVYDQELPAPFGRQRYGEFTVSPHNKIFIHSGLDPKGARFKATLSHEIGHYVLHRKFLSKSTFISSSPKIATDEELARYGRRAGISDLHWAEWQANEFMASVLLPRTGLMYRMARIQKQLGLHVGRVYIDNQGCTQADSGFIFATIAMETMIQFPIVFARMNALGLVNDKRTKRAKGTLGDEVTSTLQDFVRSLD